MARVYLTGFGRFAGVDDNPTQHLARWLDEECTADAPSVTVAAVNIVEVSKLGAENGLAELLCSVDERNDDRPAVFVHLGVDAAAATFKVETRAFNCCDYRVPDQRNWRPRDVKLDPDFPTSHTLTTAFDVERLVADLEKCGWQGKVGKSNDAGRFVCNSLYYMSLRACRENACAGPAAEPLSPTSLSPPPSPQRFPGGDRRFCIFIHVPPFSAIPEAQQRCFLVDALELIERQAVLLTEPLAGKVAAAAAAAGATAAGGSGGGGGGTSGSDGSGERANVGGVGGVGGVGSSDSANDRGGSSSGSGKGGCDESAGNPMAQTRATLLEAGFAEEDVALALETTGVPDLQRNLTLLRKFDPRATAGTVGGAQISGIGYRVGDQGYLSSMARTTGAAAMAAAAAARRNSGSYPATKLVVLVRRDYSSRAAEVAVACAQAAALACDRAAQAAAAAGAPPAVEAWRLLGQGTEALALPDPARLPTFVGLANAASLPVAISESRGADGFAVAAAIGPGDAVRIEQLTAGLQAL
ncbi:unnamed protein product [Phaeothamnion confervicola]